MLKKPYTTSHSCHNFPAGLREAARGARICETSLFNRHVISIHDQAIWAWFQYENH